MFRFQRVESCRGLLSFVFCIVGLLVAPVPGQVAGDKVAEAGHTARVSPEARKALAAAGKLARIPRGTELADRQTRLEQALVAFVEVAQRFQSEPKTVADAAFRRGQILGRLGRTDEAVAAFEQAGAKDADVFGARAKVEAGHVLRREKRYPDALRCYRRAVDTKVGKYRDHARLWIGKTLVRLGRVPEAREAWVELGGDTTADPRTRIEAFDELAMSHVREKRITEAKRVLRDAEDSLAGLTSGESKAAKGLRGGLERMRARKSIAKAEERAAGTRGRR